MSTNKNNNKKKLGGVTLTFEAKRGYRQGNQPKKHARKRQAPRGWIRGIEKANGKTYYYYCYSPRDAHGEYPEKKIYLGSAEKILEKVKGK